MRRTLPPATASSQRRMRDLEWRAGGAATNMVRRCRVRRLRRPDRPVHPGGHMGRRPRGHVGRCDRVHAAGRPDRDQVLLYPQARPALRQSRGVRLRDGDQGHGHGRRERRRIHGGPQVPSGGLDPGRPAARVVLPHGAPDDLAGHARQLVEAGTHTIRVRRRGPGHRPDPAQPLLEREVRPARRPERGRRATRTPGGVRHRRHHLGGVLPRPRPLRIDAPAPPVQALHHPPGPARHRQDLAGEEARLRPRRTQGRGQDPARAVPPEPLLRGTSCAAGGPRETAVSGWWTARS